MCAAKAHILTYSNEKASLSLSLSLSLCMYIFSEQLFKRICIFWEQKDIIINALTKNGWNNVTIAFWN